MVSEVLILPVDDLVFIDGLNSERFRELDRDRMISEMLPQGIARTVK